MIFPVGGTILMDHNGPSGDVPRRRTAPAPAGAAFDNWGAPVASRRRFLTTTSSAAALLVAGCRASNAGGPPPIGLAFETLQTEYWEASFSIFRDALREKQLEVLEAVADGDASRQLEQVKSFITRGVGGIIVAPKDASTAVPLVKAANRADTPIVFYNRPPAENAGRYVAVQADNFEISKQTVDFLARQAQQQGGTYKAMVLAGDLGDMNAIGRRDGFLAAVEQYPELIEVVSQVSTQWNQEKAQAGATAALAANPEINLIFSSSDFLLPSLVTALQSSNKYHKIGHPEHVLLAGFDGDSYAYRMMVDGYLDADGVQDVYFECEKSIEAVLALQAGEQVPKTIKDPGFVLHQGNLETEKHRMWGANV